MCVLSLTESPLIERKRERQKRVVMDGRGGCCVGIARHVGGVYDMSKVDRIMLKFRPIAPKPVAGGSTPGGPTPEKSDACVKSGRRKRRYARDSTNNTVTNKRCNRKRKMSPEENVVTTLPLLPETPDRKDSPGRCFPVGNGGETEKKSEERSSQMWLSFEGNKVGQGLGGYGGLSDRTALMPPEVQVVGSCVIVECVMDAWVDGGGLGYTDEERRRTLGKDSCPGFISDGVGTVTWTNEAYREMTMMDQGKSSEGNQNRRLMVWLVMKEESTVRSLSYSAFTCRVRLVQYNTCGKEKSSLTLPCDVWRMDGGGFAWRLDVKAALSLGR